MQCLEDEGVVFYQFAGLQSDHLRHGVFSRLGGVSQPPWHSLNVGAFVGDDPEAVRINHRRIYRLLDVPPERRATARQAGGTRVAHVTRRGVGQTYAGTDSLLTDLPGVPLIMRFADCLPIILHDPLRGVAGIVHAGWKGTVGRIAEATIKSMSGHYNCRAADIRAGIGPGIGPCCYEIGPDVSQLVRRHLPFPGLLSHRGNGRAHLDLWEANRALLAQAGVREIEVAGICTACDTESWFSHRAEKGQTGRFAAVVALGDR